MTALNDLQDVGHMRLYRLQESIEDENVSLTTTAPPMTSLDPSQSLSFPIISTPTWYIPPQIHKRSPDPHNHKTQGGAEQFWMAPWTNENEQQLAKSPPSPVQPGPEHWEEQRRKWTQGFPVLHHLTQDDIRLLNARYGRLVQYYKEITEQEKSFRRPVRLSLLIRILVAGWKDAGLWPGEETLRREILQKRLNPGDYDLTVHLSSVLDSDKPVEKELDVAVSRLLERQNHKDEGVGRIAKRRGQDMKDDGNE